MYLLTILNLMIPKKRDSLFFYDINCISLNEMAMIQYLVEHHLDKKYEISVITNRPDLVSMVIPKEYVYSNDKHGLWKQLRSKYLFLEQNSHEWSVYRAPGQKIIQLWHGLPIKKVGYLHNPSPLYAYDSVYSHVLAPSPYGWEIMKKCFHYSDHKKIISSPPRCDLMCHKLFNEQYQALGLDPNRKLILWMPTFRNNSTETDRDYHCDFPLLNAERLMMLDEYLDTHGAQLVIKLHSLQKKVELLEQNYKRIFVFENPDLFTKKIDPYSLLGSSDCLITDYSSTVYDYLLLDRPIIFTVDDLDRFLSVRGFIEDDYMSFFCGPCVSTYDHLIHEIEKALAGTDQEANASLRKKRDQLINSYHDFKNCERVFKALSLIDQAS